MVAAEIPALLDQTASQPAQLVPVVSNAAQDLQIVMAILPADANQILEQIHFTVVPAQEHALLDQTA